MKRLITFLVFVLSVATIHVATAENIATLRGKAALNEQGEAPMMTKVEK